MKKQILKDLGNLYKQISRKDTPSTESLILGLDDSLFEDPEDPIVTKLDPNNVMKAVTTETDEDFPFMYNEEIDPGIAKTILGPDFDSLGTNYHMYTDKGVTAITYDNVQGEEVVIRLEEVEHTSRYKSQPRESVVSPIKPKRNLAQIILVSIMLALALATVAIIVLLKVG